MSTNNETPICRIDYQKIATVSTQYTTRSSAGATNTMTEGEEQEKVHAKETPTTAETKKNKIDGRKQRPSFFFPLSCIYSSSDSPSWYATEKIHGAQFQFYMRPVLRRPGATKNINDEKKWNPPLSSSSSSSSSSSPLLSVFEKVEIKCAKRTGFVGEYEDFFGHLELLERRLRPQLEALCFDVYQDYEKAYCGQFCDKEAEGETSSSSTSFLSQKSAPPPPIIVAVFGELFGGWYPPLEERADWQGAFRSGRVNAKTGRVDLNYNTKTSKNQKSSSKQKQANGKVDDGEKKTSSSKNHVLPVQEGIYYSPRREFAVFDIAIYYDDVGLTSPDDGEEESAKVQKSTKVENLAGTGSAFAQDESKLCFLPFATILQKTKNANLFSPPVIACGSWSQVDDCSIEFDSLVPQALLRIYSQQSPSPSVLGIANDLAIPLPPKTNLCEGVVVRPNDPSCNVLYKNRPVRQIFKRKNAQFAEVDEIDTSLELGGGPTMASPSTILCIYLLRFLTPSRANGILSKLGVLTKQNEEKTEGDLTTTKSKTTNHHKKEGRKEPKDPHENKNGSPSSTSAVVEPATELIDGIIDDLWEDFWLQSDEFHQGLFSQLTVNDSEELDGKLRECAIELFRGILNHC